MVKEVKERNIVTSIILSIVTCGIYGIIWFIGMTDDAAYLNDDKDMQGVKSFLFGLITCGIYIFYWNYKMGKTMFEIGNKKGVQISDNSVLYLILSIFGLGIVSYCMIQSDLNKFATSTTVQQ